MLQIYCLLLVLGRASLYQPVGIKDSLAQQKGNTKNSATILKLSTHLYYDTKISRKSLLLLISHLSVLQHSAHPYISAKYRCEIKTKVKLQTRINKKQGTITPWGSQLLEQISASVQEWSSCWSGLSKTGYLRAHTAFARTKLCTMWLSSSCGAGGLFLFLAEVLCHLTQ